MMTLSSTQVENSKGEAGVGQHELNVKFSDVLGMVSRARVIENVVTEREDRKGPLFFNVGG